MKIDPLSPLGAQILDFNFDKPDRHSIERVQNALIDYKMLLFRGRTLDPPEQIRFTRLFGACLHSASPRLRYIETHPEIFVISNQKGHGNLANGIYWHSDGQDLAIPAAVTVHHIQRVTRDSVTLYVDLSRAHDTLPQHLQNDYAVLWSKAKSGKTWPLVIDHPLTKRRGLYPNLDPDPRAGIVDGLGHAKRDIGVPLARHLTRNAYRHHWRPGDLIVVDNFAVAHHALPADPKELRILHRTTVPANMVWWASQLARISA